MPHWRVSPLPLHVVGSCQVLPNRARGQFHGVKLGQMAREDISSSRRWLRVMLAFGVIGMVRGVGCVVSPIDSEYQPLVTVVAGPHRITAKGPNHRPPPLNTSFGIWTQKLRSDRKRKEGDSDGDLPACRQMWLLGGRQ